MAGQYFDAETGLHYNYHRYYDPSMGRYLRSDPIGLAGGINLFVYAQNNPVNYIDEFGLEAIDPTFDFPNYTPSPVNIGKLVTGILSVADGATMVSVAFGVTTGAAVLTKSPKIAGALGVMMIPVAVGGVGDIGHGFVLMYEAFDELPTPEEDGLCN